MQLNGLINTYEDRFVRETVVDSGKMSALAKHLH